MHDQRKEHENNKQVPGEYLKSTAIYAIPMTLTMIVDEWASCRWQINT